MKMFDKMKLKARMIALQPQIVKRIAKYQGMERSILKTMMVQKFKAIIDHENNDTVTDEIINEFMIDQAAICTAYFMGTGQIPNQDQMNSFIHDCGIEAGISEDKLKLMTS